MPRRWYQTIELEGVDAIFEDIKRKNSKFWNEGKWDNFIKPLLPKERQTFIEIGCNAGLFLKMATDAGFKNVVGVERNRQIFNQAKCFREHTGGKYRLVNEGVGVDLRLEDLPISDVVLIANAHYYFTVGAFSKLVDSLRNRSLYCIVVSARAKRRKGNALYDINSVRGYFRDWHEITTIEDVDIEGDPCPRPQMYSVLFRGNLSTLDVNDYHGAWFEAAKDKEHRSYMLAPSMQDFFTKVLSGENFEIEDTSFYEYWRDREPHRSPEWTKNFLSYKAGLAKDIQGNGIKEPIYINQDGMLLDGLHRLCIAKLLGYKHIICKRH